MRAKGVEKVGGAVTAPSHVAGYHCTGYTLFTSPNWSKMKTFRSEHPRHLFFLAKPASTRREPRLAKRKRFTASKWLAADAMHKLYTLKSPG